MNLNYFSSLSPYLPLLGIFFIIWCFVGEYAEKYPETRLLSLTEVMNMEYHWVYRFFKYLNKVEFKIIIS